MSFLLLESGDHLLLESGARLLLDSLPVLTNIVPQFVDVPASGSATITGSGFTPGATVTFGGVATSNVVVVDDGTITCDIPLHAAGQVVVTVTNP